MESSNKNQIIEAAKNLKKQATIYMWLQIASLIASFIVIIVSLFIPSIVLLLVGAGLEIACIVYTIFILISSNKLKNDSKNAKNVFAFSIVMLCSIGLDMILSFIIVSLFSILILIDMIVFFILIIVYSNKTYKEIVDSQNVIIENKDDKNTQDNENTISIK